MLFDPAYPGKIEIWGTKVQWLDRLSGLLAGISKPFAACERGTVALVFGVSIPVIALAAGAALDMAIANCS